MCLHISHLSLCASGGVKKAVSAPTACEGPARPRSASWAGVGPGSGASSSRPPTVCSSLLSAVRPGRQYQPGIQGRRFAAVCGSVPAFTVQPCPHPLTGSLQLADRTPWVYACQPAANGKSPYRASCTNRGPMTVPMDTSGGPPLACMASVPAKTGTRTEVSRPVRSDRSDIRPVTHRTRRTVGGPPQGGRSGPDGRVPARRRRPLPHPVGALWRGGRLSRGTGPPTGWMWP